MEHATNNSFMAQDLAGKAILFEIGARAGILNYIENNHPVTVHDLKQQLAIKEDFLTVYLDTLTSLGLLSKQADHNAQQATYHKSSIYEQEKNKIGYISWGMMSCAPLITNTPDFIKDFDSAVREHHRCGEHVARTSKWMGEKDFYPHAEEVILGLNPKKVVDLGSGTCGLLIRLAKQLNHMKGVGVDLSKDACDKAKEYIKQQSLTDRIDVIESPIQDLIKNKQVFADADVVHAGFVFHDLMPDEEATLDKLLACIHESSPKVTLVIADAVPFSQNSHERAFSSAFSFLHRFYMGRQLLPEMAWQEKLKKAGFSQVSIQPLGISGGRVIVATC